MAKKAEVATPVGKMGIAEKRSLDRNRTVKAVHEQMVDKYLERFGTAGPGDVSLANAIYEAQQEERKEEWLVRGNFLSRTDIQNIICDLVADGASLKGLCKVEGFPSFKTLMRWLDVFPEFAHQYQFAEKCRALLLFEERLEIADGATPKESFVAKLQMDIRQDMAGVLDRRWHPKTLVENTVRIEGDHGQLSQKLRLSLLNQAERLQRDLGVAVVELSRIAEFVVQNSELLESLGLTIVKNAAFKETIINMDELMSIGRSGKPNEL